MNQQWLPGNIRDRIRDLYRAAGMKQSDLADAIGIDKSTLSRFMTGKTDKLSDSNIQKIARYFKVSTDFLLGITEVSDRKTMMLVNWDSQHRQQEICSPGKWIRGSYASCWNIPVLLI